MRISKRYVEILQVFWLLSTGCTADIGRLGLSAYLSERLHQLI